MDVRLTHSPLHHLLLGAAISALTRTWAAWSIVRCHRRRQTLRQPFARRLRHSRLELRPWRNAILSPRRFLRRKKRRFFPRNGFWLGITVSAQKRVITLSRRSPAKV